MGYLGKISAVVGVSTGDFSSKLNRCKQDTDRFAKSVTNSLNASSGSASRSFDGMYTSLQRFERAKQAALSKKLEFTGLKDFPGLSLEQAAVAMEHMQSAAHSITGPLGEIAKRSEAMSRPIQEAFRPALQAAQESAEKLRVSVETTGKMIDSEFLAAEQQVERVTKAFHRLTEAEQMAGRLQTGHELRFQQPRAHDELSRAATTGAAISAMPSRRLTPDLIALVQLQKEAADSVAKYNAALQASPSAKAQKDLNQRVALLREVNNELAKELSSYDKITAKTRDAKAAATELNAQLNRIGESIGMPAKPIDALDASIKKAAADVAKMTDNARKAKAELKLAALQQQAFDVAAMKSGKNKAANVAIMTRNAGRISDFAGRPGILEMARADDWHEKAAGFSGNRRNRGDIGRFGADKFALGMNQAAFAVDDFMSATGGMEQKLRAVSNNLTQLGFVVGGTKGLMIALGAVIIANSGFLFQKFIHAMDGSIRKAEELKATLATMNSSFEKERSIIDSLADSYKNLGQEITASLLSKETGIANERKNRASDLREQQAAARTEAVTQSGSFEVLFSRRNVEKLEKQMSEEADPAKRFALAAQIAKERAAEKNAGEVVENRARQRLAMNSPAKLRAMQGDVSGRVAALSDVRAAHVGDAATTAKLNVALDDAIRELTILDTALRMIGDDAKATAVEAFGPLQDKLKGLQEELAAVEGQHPDVALLQKRLDSTAFDVGAAFASASTTEQAREQSAALMKAMTPLGTEVAAVVERATKLQAEKKEFAESVTRGQTIGMTPAQKAAKEASDMATDIANAASEMTDSVARQAFVGGFVESKREELQSALKGYSDERLNALAGGPSRAALDATDVTTAGGSTELNRLLRGDDASKDANFAELKHQSELLERVIDAVKAATGFIAS